MNEQQQQKIREILESFRSAMLVTRGANDLPLHARPMEIAGVEPDCGVWFFTGRASAKVDEIINDQHVLILCQDEHRRYLTLCGTAQLVSDRNKIEQYWKEPYKAWFPQGMDDPDLLLIHVRGYQAEYWDNQGLKGLKYIFEAAKAYARGTRPQIQEGEQHAQVTLKH
jgi:general stress protein 26